MPEMDWQMLQYPAFQVLRSSLSQDDRPAPLQIRSFTSESYRAIKERERKKRTQQNNRHFDQWSKTRNKEILRESGPSEAVLEMPQMDAEPNNDVCASDSGHLQSVLPVNQNGSQNQPGSPGAAPLSLLEVQSEDTGQFLPYLTPPAISLNDPDTSRSEILVGAAQGCETLQEGDPHQSPTSVDACIAAAPDDDAGNSDQQLENGGLHRGERAVATITYPAPIYNDTADSSVAREHLTQADDTESASPVSPESNSYRILPVTPGPRRRRTVNELAVTEALSDARCHGFRDSWNDGSRACRVESNWTMELDEHLLHLRDVAQLKWGNLVTYFPGLTLNAVKTRYKNLNEGRTTRQIVGDEPTSRTFPTAVKIRQAPSTVKSRIHRVRTLAEHRRTPRRRHVPKQANKAKDAGLRTVLTHEDACQQTSRCGRPIRHPFRHRRSEGYL